jgi:hypothetical protein
MVLCTLINISLDISTNISWWIFKNTLYGTYYITTYFIAKPPKQTKEEIELLELRKEISHLNRKLYYIDSINNNSNIISRTNIPISDDKNLENSFIFIDDTDI